MALQRTAHRFPVRPALLAMVAVLIFGLSAGAVAQRRRGFGGFSGSRMLRGQQPNAPYDGRFTFVRRTQSSPDLHDLGGDAIGCPGFCSHPPALL